MGRRHNRKSNGKQFPEDIIELVWKKAKVMNFFHPDLMRIDVCGAIIVKTDFGNTNSKFGWEIDHIIPVSLDGTDNIENLQPLQWENNRAKGNNYPEWYGLVNSFKSKEDLSSEAV